VIEKILKSPPCEIQKKVAVKRYHKGDVILFQGNDESNVYIILEGRVKVFSISLSGKQYVSQYLEAINLFGDVEAILQKQVDNMIVAQTECRIMQMKSPVFFEWMRRDWNFSYAVLRLLTEKLTETNEKAKQRYFLTVDEQIYQIFEKAIEDGRYVIEKSFIKQEIYTTTRSINRSLKKYVEQGAIEIQKGKIRIVDKNKIHLVIKNINF
jgi:CRP-like cAMP-binding protein